jgi:integrase
MTRRFESYLSQDLEGFLDQKRALGHAYRRAEFTLRRFDRFVAQKAKHPRDRDVGRLLHLWLAGFRPCKRVTVAHELSVVRQFCRFRRRRDPGGFVPGPDFVPRAKGPRYLPYILSLNEIRLLLRMTRSLRGPRFRALTFWHLLLMLYCTGLRFGEAVRLRIQDCDLRARTLFIAPSKRRSRWVPFDKSLARELHRYLDVRQRIQPSSAQSQLFVQPNGRPYCTAVASGVIRRLLRSAGLKPAAGRVGPRPYDTRHAFAVQRLTRWYRQGVDLHERLPWLSVYMGHGSILGTEVYLHVTPELLELAGRRFAAHVGRR